MLINRIMKVFTILILMSTNFVLIAGTEDKVGNGGYQVGLEFTQGALRALTVLTSHSEDLPEELQEINLKELSEAIESTKLEIKNSLCSQDPNTSAIDCPVARNFPEEKLIQISTQDWRVLASNPKLQVAIALHEYLGILGTESNVYYISARLDKWLNNEPIENRLASFKPGDVFLLSDAIQVTDSNHAANGIKILNVDLKMKKIYFETNFITPPENLNINAPTDDKNKYRYGYITCETLLAQNCHVRGGIYATGRTSLYILPDQNIISIEDIYNGIICLLKKVIPNK